MDSKATVEQISSRARLLMHQERTKKYCDMFSCRFIQIFLCYSLLLLCNSCTAFNVDTENHVVHTGETGSKFGFTVAQYIDQEDNW